MRTEPAATSLPERDLLDMSLSFTALQESMGRVPAYRVLFRLNILNAGEESVRLIGRKWMLRDTAGETRIVEAAEVFNQQPVLKAGEVFTYSGCREFSPAAPRAMELRLFGTDQSNRAFITPGLVFPRKCFGGK